MATAVRATPSVRRASTRSARRDDNQMLWQTPDPVGFVLGMPLEAEPGRRFVYSNGSAVVVGAILAQATGIEVEDFAQHEGDVMKRSPLQVLPGVGPSIARDLTDRNEGLAREALTPPVGSSPGGRGRPPGIPSV